MSPEVCPNCGASVPHNAKTCPGCGSDEKTGWSDSAYASHLGIPEEKFDYGDFVKEEFGSRSPKPRGIGWLWWLAALLLVLAFLLFLLR
jgi:RNA polymerase subunit RPABC4/transcription elongation factor Spt4